MIHGDSDEEAGAACSAVGRRPGGGSSGASLRRAAADLRCAHCALSSLPECVPAVVPFCVDGKHFAVSRDTLLRDPQSALFILAAQHYARSGCTAAGPVMIPCRDPALFAVLLNVVRGYRRAVPDALRDLCWAEARFYGLERSWRAHNAATSPVSFRPLLISNSTGTGTEAGVVCMDRLAADFVCAAAGPRRATGLHCVTFRVERCESAALGVAEDGAPRGSADGIQHSCDGMALFWSDGRVVHNFGRRAEEKTGHTFAARTDVRVELDCDDRLVRWVLPGEQCAAVVRLPARRSFSIIALATRFSEISEIKPMRRACGVSAIVSPVWCALRGCAAGGEKAAADPSVEKPCSPSAAEVMRAVRERDFSALQSHVAIIAQERWKEEHSIPAACVFFFLLTWYWASSARRRVARACAAAEARTREAAEETVRLARGLTQSWSREVQRADARLQHILDKNSELTKDIDRMTAALRQCYVGAPGKGHQQMQKTQ